MKVMQLTTLAAVAVSAALSSCVNPYGQVAEMPYHPRRVVRKTIQQQPQETPPVQTTTWESAPAANNYITQPPPAPAPAPPNPATPPEVKPYTATEPVAAPRPTPSADPMPKASEPSPSITPTPPAPTPTASNNAGATDLKQITNNNGLIPTATRVEGDPTRVWNPLDPSKTIRIINPKTNQPFPSGKKLKVRGTNYQFYVP